MSSVRGVVLRYAAAATLVRLGDEGSRVALTFLAVAAGLGAGVGGGLIAALLVPHVLAAPVVGTVIDRAPVGPRRVALLVAGFAAALGSAAVLVGRAPVVVVVLVLLLGGCCGPALTGGSSSVLPDVVPPPSLPRAFGVDSLTYNVAGVAGPAVAAVLAGAWSPEGATWVLAASAGTGAILLTTLPGRDRSGRSRVDADSASDSASDSDRDVGWLAGARAIVRDRPLAAVTGATSLGQVGAGALPVVAAVIALHAGHPGQAGVLLAAIAVGGLLGSLLWTARPAPSWSAPRVVMLGLVGAGVPLMVAAGTGSLSVRAGLFALSGVADGPLFGALLLSRQDRAPESARSQVFTLGAGAKITAAAAGAALGGAVSGLAVGAQLVLAGGLHVLAGAVGAVVLRRRRYDRPVAAGPARRRTPR